jgi:hypothetical protein
MQGRKGAAEGLTEPQGRAATTGWRLFCRKPVAAAEFPTIWAVTFHGTLAARSWGARIYERGEVFLEFFTFLVVISLIFRASAYLKFRGLMRVG